MSEQVSLAVLKHDERLYPRQNVNERHINLLKTALEAGETLPPIVVDTKTKTIVDGIHRWQAHAKVGAQSITVEYRTYASTADLFRDAVLLNSAHGLQLDTHDKLKVIEIGESLGFKELDLSAILRTSIAHLRAIKPRFATVEETKEGVSELRKVALKSPVRHLSGKRITVAQADAIASGAVPGQGYLLHVRQLIAALELNLMPAADVNPTLWSELRRLRELIPEN